MRPKEILSHSGCRGYSKRRGGTMTLTQDQVKEANAERLAQSRREKAEEYTIEQEAARSRSWYDFIRRHVGSRAIQNNSVFVDNQANVALMEDFCRKQDPPYIDLEN